jgi:hypothetical protein
VLTRTLCPGVVQAVRCVATPRLDEFVQERNASAVPHKSGGNNQTLAVRRILRTKTTDHTDLLVVLSLVYAL